MSALSHALNASRLERLWLYDHVVGRVGVRVFLNSDGRCTVCRIDAMSEEQRYEYYVDHAVVRRFESALERCEYTPGVARIDLGEIDESDLPLIVVCLAAGVSHVVKGHDNPDSAWHTLYRGLLGLTVGLEPDDQTYNGPFERDWLPIACN